MQLNESAARLDTHVESVAKKIEKIQADTSAEPDTLKFKQNYAGEGSKSQQSSFSVKFHHAHL